MFYDNVRCKIALGTETHEGFAMHTGIRQGCPLSPLLFAIVADLLLRRLDRLIPDAMTRAYADDTAMILQSMSDLPHVAKIFDEYGTISGLELNLAKTILIPLFHVDLVQLHAAVAHRIPW